MDTIQHIVNRGVDKRVIFNDNQDYLRFIHDMFEFNDEEPINSTWYKFKKSNNPEISVIRRRNIEKAPRKLLVDILAFCLMPNHYHLLLTPRKENAVPKFMKKLNMGYARYFNTKNTRSGALFEGRYRSVDVIEQAHFLYVPFYIHLNPLDLHAPSWRNGLIQNSSEALNFLENYRWSSFPDYMGKKNFPSVTSRDFLLEFFEGAEKHKQDMLDWLQEREPDGKGSVFLE
ncbi:MAG: hypothetical protein A3J55_03490 [Candidatus Ryanbacteria bacterium RIFCSPHIGHO2_02_FULL_45_17b]|uniref:Transposase IS200-like domain-containing protein n=1 Tax=Candidatus Ryanbacteria bacterium RIFCSPHIGHO2_01_FULL_45_22 TaxID=1802114 RepID=A0A1G2G234_9BACT|nr:MAG: hypothetical protein A2719_04695 [Candidatus Ryanbacteria bacterium RIFCSPHIGHO2_01_FULL_45_22]OGZ47524.1 MAG: hypothetical protein A3J55_03490 [Candidatus Ryanbacteria bacterium RIFCSPHIGHO2_02_FULL_45_17b]